MSSVCAAQVGAQPAPSQTEQVVRGCVTRVAGEAQPAEAPAADTFLLTAGDQKTTYRLMPGRDDVDLAKHVGQQVELHGYTPPTAARHRGDDHERVQGGQMQDVGQTARTVTPQRPSSTTVAEADASPRVMLRVTAVKLLAKVCPAVQP